MQISMLQGLSKNVAFTYCRCHFSSVSLRWSEILVLTNKGSDEEEGNGRKKSIFYTRASTTLCLNKLGWLWSELGGPASHHFPAELSCTYFPIVLHLFFGMDLEMPRGWGDTDWLCWVPVARAARRALPSPTPLLISICVSPQLMHWVSSLSLVLVD